MKIALLIILSALLTPMVSAQKITYAPTSSWFTMINHVTFNEHWSFTLETHERLGDLYKTQGQFLSRPCINYTHRPNVIFSFGYSFINVQPYEPYTLPIARNEINLWEQVIIKNELGNVHSQLRIREENRWVQHIVQQDSSYHISGNDYANRLRLRWTGQRKLKTFGEKKSLSVILFDELWLAQNGQLLPTAVARNWLFVGMGFEFNPKTEVQLGYMHQWDRVGENHYVSTPIVQCTLITKWSFKKKSTL